MIGDEIANLPQHAQLAADWRGGVVLFFHTGFIAEKSAPRQSTFTHPLWDGCEVELVPSVPVFYQPDMGIIVADAHDRNILRNESGRLVPIDLVIGQPGPELLRLILDQLA